MNNIFPKIIVLNRYYRITRFYVFLKDVLVKALIILGIFMGMVFLFDYFVLDIRELFNYVETNFSSLVVFIVFFISELLMGVVPPEIFIAWGLETLEPWQHMFVLSALSYISGIFAYWVGVLLYRNHFVRKYVDGKFSNYKRNLRRWGGLFIFVGAMLPMPHALVSFAAGIVKFNFENYLMWSLFRFARFFAFALVMLQIL